VPLAPAGEAEARAVAQRLQGVSLSAVISSGLARAEFGAALLRASRGLPRRDEPELREIARGSWAGVSLEELERRSPGSWQAWHRSPELARPPGGESMGDLAARVLPALDRLALEFARSAIAIVTHSWVVRTAMCEALSLPLSDAPTLDVPTGCLVAFEWPGEQGRGAQRPSLVGFGLDDPPPDRR
jgi:broad specificity phosphatase PhoE